MGADEMLVALEFAALAPSVHNTQPWRFLAGSHTIEIHVDPSRQLDNVDSDGRQMYLSCGVAAEFARLAIRFLGLACTIRLLPDPAQETLVAKLVVGFREPITLSEQRLIEAIPRRYTDRGPYTDEPVSRVALQRMREAASERHCWLRVLDRADDRLTVIRLLETAEDAEAADERYREEMFRWQRVGLASDGIPVDNNLDWKAQHRVSDVPLRDFGGFGRHPHPDDDDVTPAVERDTIVLLGTDRDDRLSWLQAGRALADVLLVLTDEGLVSQPLGPVLDLPTMRADLRREVGLVGHPQLLLRVGHGQRLPVTRRRPIDEMLLAATAP
jgi:hypothetical protein